MELKLLNIFRQTAPIFMPGASLFNNLIRHEIVFRCLVSVFLPPRKNMFLLGNCIVKNLFGLCSHIKTNVKSCGFFVHMVHLTRDLTL